MYDSNNDNNETALRRDEAKRKAAAQKQLQDKIDSAASVLQLVKAVPAMWEKPEMKLLRQLTYEITGDPKTYKPNKDDGGHGIGIDQLTKGIGSLLFNRDMPMDSNTDEIILYITHADNVTESNVVAELGTTAINTRRWKISAIDGDKKYITVRVDSTLSSAGNLLIPGAVISVSKFIPIYWNYQDKSDTRCAIVIQEFKVVGQHPVPDELLKRPTQNKRVVPVNTKKKVAHKKKKQRTDVEANATVCKCTGNLCSKNGVEFVTCLILHVSL